MIDLRGNEAITDTPADATRIQWKHFFGAAASMGRPLDANLPTSIFRLPPPSVGEPPISLAERKIRRGVDFGLPSGQEVARILGSVYGTPAVPIPILTADRLLPPDVLAQFPEVSSVDAQFAVATPLWFYILREASELEPATSFLGPVGGLIVGETILGALAASTGFDLGLYLNGNYASEAAAAQVGPPPVTDHADIRTMTQLLNFIGTPV